jgi:Glutaredoxin
MKITSLPQQSFLTVLRRRFRQVVALVAVSLIVTISKTTTKTVSSFTIIPSGSGHCRTGSTSLLHGGLLSDFFNEGKAKLMKSMAGEYDSAAIQQQINTYIQNNPVLMFSFDTCPYCIKAKSILDSKNIKYDPCCFYGSFYFITYYHQYKISLFNLSIRLKKIHQY